MKKEILVAFIKLFKELEEAESVDKKQSCLQIFPFRSILKQVLRFCYSPKSNLVCERINIQLGEEKKIKHGDHLFKRVLRVFDNYLNENITLESCVSKLNRILSNLSKKEGIFYKKIFSTHIKNILPYNIIQQTFPHFKTIPIKFEPIPNFDDNIKIKYPVFVEPHYGGIRIKLYAINTTGEADAISTSGKSYSSYFKEYLEVLQTFALSKEKKIQIEGEIFCKSTIGTHHAINSLEKTKEGIKFYANDLIIGSGNIPFRRRKRMLLKFSKRAEEIIKNKGLNVKIPLEVVPHAQINSYKELKESLEAACLNGLDGILIKDPIAKYTQHYSCMILHTDENVYLGEVIEIEPKSSDKCKVKAKYEYGTVDIDLSGAKGLWYIKNKNNLIGAKCRLDLSKKCIKIIH